MNVLILSHDVLQTICEIRLGIPLRELQQSQAGLQLRWRNFYQPTRHDWRWADVVVMQRAMGRRLAQRVRWLATQGVAVVYEIDDLLTEPADHLMHARQIRSELGNITDMLRHAHLITTTTARLQARLQHLGTPVARVPNYATLSHQAPALHRPGRVTLVVAASDRQQVATLTQAIKALAPAVAAQVEVLAIGPVAQSLREAGLVCRTLPLLGRDAFLHTVRSLPNPVGLLPLDDSGFSSCKSAVKFYDYASCGVVSVCAAVPPYADEVAHGRTGWLVPDEAQAWQAAIETLVEDAALRDRIAQAAVAQVRAQHGLGRTVQAWGQALAQARTLAGGKADTAWTARLTDHLVQTVEAHVLIPLRELNRVRMQRRQARRKS